MEPVSIEPDPNRLLLTDAIRWRHYIGLPRQRRHHGLLDWRVAPPYSIFCFIYSGCLLIEMGDGGVHRFTAGELCVVPSLCRYRVGMDGPTELSHSHDSFMLFGTTDIFSYYVMPLKLQGAIAAEAGAILERLPYLLNVTAPANLADAAESKQLGHRLLALVLSASQRNDQPLLLSEMGRLQHVLRYIEGHLADPLSRSDLAALCDLSESHFTEVFAKAVGMSPMRYLRQSRMNKAKELLVTSDAGLKAIASLCGFPDPLHFSKQFRKLCGLSPSKYRENHRFQT